MSPTLAEVIAVLERAYPPALAEDWDAVGLVCGDPDEPVRRIVVAVDPVAATVDETVEADADLLLTHHPLLLRGVHGVPADDPRGALVHRLIRANAGLYCAHTNADSADPGVSDALADALGVTVERPLRAQPGPARDVLAVTVPVADVTRVREALFAAGAGAVGDYDRACSESPVTGRFRPLPDARPASGVPGTDTETTETRVELIVPRERRRSVIAALRGAHPYEEPAFTLHEQAELPGCTGIGRIGELAVAEPLSVFVRRVADALPATAWGVRAAGDPDRPVRRVAVSGGAGDSLLGAAAAAGVDAYVTADLRHHPASDHLAAGGPALVDVAHWASEWPWCTQVAAIIVAEFGGTVDVRVSRRRTDPWTLGATRTSEHDAEGHSS